MPCGMCHSLSLNISSLKKHFQTLQTEITDNFRPTVIEHCETKIDSNIEQLYNLAGVGLFTVYFILLQKYLYNKYSLLKYICSH